MKNTILTIALITSFSAFTFASYNFAVTSGSTTIVCDGGHECDGKCKKDKNGKCVEAKADAKGDQNTAHACCAKGKKSCKGKEKKSDKEVKKENKSK